MKKIGFLMSLYMGLTLSVFLTFTGVGVGMLPNVIAGRLPKQALIVNMIGGFFVSFAISMLIGLIVPMHKVTGALTKNMRPGVGKLLLESLLSDIIYTPLISACMVALAYFRIDAPPGEKPSYIHMLIPSLAACFIVAYILILVFQPMFLKKLMKKYGGPQGGPPGGMPPAEG